jgi:hypothetical protein
MTSPVASVGLEYDGTDLQQPDLQWFLEIARGLNESPSVRGKDWIVPARAGRVPANRVNDVLKIELVGIVTADPTLTDPDDQRASYRVNVQIIRGLFAPNRAVADLVATLETGDIVSISARPRNLIWNERVQALFATVSIELEGLDDWVLVAS